MNGSLHLWLIPLLPFAGFVLNGILGRKLPKALVTAIALLAPLGAFGVVLNAAFIVTSVRCVSVPPWTRLRNISLPHVENYGNWINAGLLHADFSFVLDQLSLVMLLIITGVGFLIHIYSVGYMEHEDGYWRYFAYLNLFLFFMTVLVLAGNALLMFVGWEGVGLASYLLIGFWFQKTSAADAGKKAFVVNRIGDFGFLIGMFLPAGVLWHAELQRNCFEARCKPRLDRRRPDSDCALPASGRYWQECAASALRLASRRDGRPDARVRADPRGNDGDGGRLHDCS